jgi:hypothetical protein
LPEKIRDLSQNLTGFLKPPLPETKAFYLDKESTMEKMGAAYIMNSDTTSVDDQGGAAKLYREGLEFDTRAKTDVLTEDMPKKASKQAVDPSVMKMAEERDY